MEKYDNGRTMREHIRDSDSDTIIEFIYFENGAIFHKNQILNNQKNGRSYTYSENGDVLFHENYLNDVRTGKFKCFYSSGQLSRLEHFKDNKNIDTSTYFDENGQVIKKIVFLFPCEFGSRECNQKVTVFDNGSEIYSFEVKDGVKSKNHIIHDRATYDKLMSQANQTPLYEKGKSIFLANCGMCHRFDKQLIGPALNCITRTKNGELLTKVIGGENGHPSSKLSEEELNALIEFLNKNCKE